MRMAVVAGFAPALIVRHDQDDVGPGGRARGAKARRDQEHEQGSCKEAQKSHGGKIRPPGRRLAYSTINY
jgi:hypothetical protein